MPKFLERKLKAEYGAHSKIPYKVMNAIGAMRGNKETAKGARMEQQHVADTAAKVPHPHRNLGSHLKPAASGEYVTNHHRGAKQR